MRDLEMEEDKSEVKERKERRGGSVVSGAGCGGIDDCKGYMEENERHSDTAEIEEEPRGKKERRERRWLPVQNCDSKCRQMQ